MDTFRSRGYLVDVSRNCFQYKIRRREELHVNPSQIEVPYSNPNCKSQRNGLNMFERRGSDNISTSCRCKDMSSYVQSQLLESNRFFQRVAFETKEIFNHRPHFPWLFAILCVHKGCSIL